ncbi:MAG: hypothetical protein IJ867_08470 [Clostridia bacterium]|nr:hypothetical protein [Clostridia bacterium]
MEEKNVTKISLSTFFLILAIIAIVIMGVFIYKLNNEKTIETQKSANLQAQVNNLNGTVSDLNGKINSISNTLNTNNASNTTNSTTNNDNSSNTNTINKENEVNIVGKYISENTSLELYTNGIFKYEYSEDISVGTIGNYIINNDKITLISWFNTGNDVGLIVTKGEKTLTINSDNSITDNNFKHSNSKTIKLEKKSDLQEYDISNKLAGAVFYEESHTIEEPNM